MLDEKQKMRLNSVPQRFLDFVCPHSSLRKFRLVACAYARHAWNLLTDERSRKAVEIAERFADGDCTTASLLEAQEEAALVAAAALQRDKLSSLTRATRLAVAATLEDAYSAVYVGTLDVPHLYPSCAGYGSEYVHAWREQIPILHDIYGNTLLSKGLSSVSVHERIVELARMIYEKREYQRMPDLADLLETTNCGHSELIAHCKEPSGHVRGCWALDFVLGKE